MYQLLKNGLFSIRLHRSFSVCLGLLFLFITSTAIADSNLAVILSKNNKNYSLFTQALKKQFNSSNTRISVLYANELEPSHTSTSQKILKSAQGIIIAGELAARSIQDKQIELPTIYALLPDKRLNHYINNNNYCKKTKRCSGVYINQPLERKLKITEKAFPNLESLAVLIGENDLETKNRLTALSKNFKFHLFIKSVSKTDNIVAIINDIADKADALLAIANQNIYNRKTAKGILLSTYNNNIPLIGYSSSFVKAGALFSVYSNPQQIAIQVSEIVDQLTTTVDPGIYRKPEYPKYFTVQVNRAVKQSLTGKILFDSSITKYSTSNDYE